jgi:nucleotide-binding universal stress UspA family protein
MYKRILAAIDLTPNENTVLSHTQELATLTGAAVHLLHVAPVHRVPGEMLGEGVGLVSDADDIDAREMDLCNRAIAQLTAAGIRAEGQMIRVVAGAEDDIANVILRRAKELGADLIVLGETLHGGLARLFRGSVADQVIHHHPPCSVLLVH